MIFWLTEGFWNLFDNSEKLQDHADVVEGVQTGNNLRWLRFFWEIPEDYKHREREWACYLKGGGYRRWAGLDETMVRWSESGDLLAQFPGATLRNRERYFGLGLSYTDFANGCLGVRLLRGDEVFDLGAPAVFSKPISPWTLEKLACILNCRICSVLIRFLSPNPQHIRTGYLRLIPLPLRLPDPNADAVVRWCVKQCIEIESQFNLLSRHFLPNSLGSVSAMLTHSLKLAFGDTFLEKAAFECFGLQESDTEVVVNQTGRPLFMLPLLDGYSSVPGDLLDREANTLLAATVGNLTTVSLDETGLRQKRSAIRSAFESGSTFMGAPEGDSGHSADEEEGEDEQFEETVIPPQTAIEALAIQLSLHPMSIYLLLQEGIGREGWRCLAEERRLHEDHFTVKVLRVLGHRWPEQIEAGESVPVWSDQDGVVPLTGGGETTLLERVRKRLVEDFPGGNVAALEREFEEIVGVPLEQWLSGPFFQRHISHFKKRPIAWQIETDARGQRLEGRKKKRGEVARPVFACLIYYHKLDEDLLPKIRTQYVGVLRSGFETELRTLEHLGNATPAQQGRKLQLDQWIEEMKAFDVKLEQVSLTGFGPPAIRPALRQYAINDALLSLTATWLGRLNETVASGPLKKWLDAAAATKLHPDFPRWMEGSLSHLDYFCAVLGPTPPKEDTFPADPTSPDLAPLVCHDAKGMVKESIKLACARWWKLLDETVLEPLRQEVKAATEEIKKLDVELKTAGLAFQRRNELGERKHELKQKVKTLRKEHDEKSSLAKRVREEIEDWTCPKAETWKLWLSEQPLFDKVASLDGKREPPQTLAEFIAQESAYAPDINDGVRVNIAPLQKAGLLHTDVLDSKDADKAIADRAEWRSDERRWVREGKLPQPGWWESKKSTT